VAAASPLPDAADGRLVCTQAACTLQPARSGAAAMLVRGKPPPEACATSVVVSAEPLRLDCGGTVPVIDRFSVWREGAHAIWLDPDGARVVTDRGLRGDRPWVVPRPTKGRLPPGPVLPVAPIDD
jgi:competence protein ComEC